MPWKRLLAYITGSVDQNLLLRSAYLVTENRILRGQIRGPLRLTDGERKSLAEISKQLGRKALEEIANIVMPIVMPDTILAWHRRLVAKKFDGSNQRKNPGRPSIDAEVEKPILQFAIENRTSLHVTASLRHLRGRRPRRGRNSSERTWTCWRLPISSRRRSGPRAAW